MENKIHHANIVLGGEGKNFVFEILKEKLSFKTQGNPDFLMMENESFGIDDSRSLSVWAAGKPLAGEVKAALLIIKSITVEAQNALLKVFEEPPAGTYFFINIESLGGLLPTLMSRVMVLKAEQAENIKEENNAKKFLSSKIKERLSLIRSLSKKEDKSEMKELLKELETASYNGGTYDPKTMRSILKAKILSSARGSSPKMLLEWLSIVV